MGVHELPQPDTRADGDFLSPVGTTEFPNAADDWLEGSMLRACVGGRPVRLPFPEEEVSVDGPSLLIFRRRRDVAPACTGRRQWFCFPRCQYDQGSRRS